MSRRRDEWPDAGHARRRLTAWFGGPRDDGDTALTALADISLLRGQLDQAELAAVRSARRHGRSWTEIATMLGITRQSAWEKWRELDASAAEAIALESAAVEPPAAERLLAAPSGVLDRAARRARRHATVTVPNVVGLSWERARTVLLEQGLVAVGPDPDGPPLGALAWPDGVVTDQSPESGARVPSGAQVRLWIERGGGTGVREPRRPRPVPQAGRAMRDERSDEAVG